MRREVNVALVFARSAAIMHLQSPRTVKHVSRGHAHAAVLHPAGSIVAAALPLIARAILLVRVLWEVVWQVKEVLLAAVPLVIDDHADDVSNSSGGLETCSSKFADGEGSSSGASSLDRSCSVDLQSMRRDGDAGHL